MSIFAPWQQQAAFGYRPLGVTQVNVYSTAGVPGVPVSHNFAITPTGVQTSSFNPFVGQSAPFGTLAQSGFAAPTPMFVLTPAPRNVLPSTFSQVIPTNLPVPNQLPSCGNCGRCINCAPGATLPVAANAINGFSSPVGIPQQTVQPGFGGIGNREPVSAQELANFPGLERTSPRMQSLVGGLAQFAWDWRVNQAPNPMANRNDPRYQAGQVAYRMMTSARQRGTQIMEGNLPPNIRGLNHGAGQLIQVQSGMSDEQTLRTFVHELGHNNVIGNVNVGSGNSVEEEATNNYLADVVVNGIQGLPARPLEYWRAETAPRYPTLQPAEGGYFQRISQAILG